MTNSLTQVTLTNGLKVLLKEIHTAPIISSWLWYRVGSKDEVPGHTGISHWVEHMQFKGTPQFPANILDKAVSREGGSWNAFTYMDWTAYFETMPADKIDLALRLESDRMANSQFDASEVASERTVIISEREGSENEPLFLLGEAIQHAAFRIPPQNGEVRLSVEGPGATTYAQVCYRFPAASHPDFFALSVLDSLLAGPSNLNMFSGGISNKTSRLYRALVDKELAVSIHGGSQATIDPFLYTISMTIHPKRKPEEALSAVEKEIQHVREEKVTKEEIARAIKQARALFAYGSENITKSALPGPNDIYREVLPNGITVLTRSNFNSPSVVISGYFNAGAILDTDEKLGLADFVTSALMRGTQKRTFDKIYNELEAVGASLGFSSGVHRSGFNGRSLSEDLPLLLRLLSESLTQPSFPKVEVEKLRSQILTGLAIRAQDTGDMASMLFDEILFKDHPLGGWQVKGQKEAPELPEVKLLKKTVSKSHKIAGKSQSDLVIGTNGPRRKDPEFMSALIGNSILGQFGMMGRIGDVVREKSGLAYYAGSSLNAGIGPGSWEVSAGVNPQNVKKASELIVSELRRFVDEGVMADELADVQANFIGRLPLSLESNGGVANALLNIERHDLGLDYYHRYEGLVGKVTRDNVLSTARKFIDPDKLAIAEAGA